MPKSKWLIVPVEVKDREFESRLLLSLYAISKGYKVIFGDQRSVVDYLNQLPKGIYFDKSISKNKIDLLKKISGSGFTLTCLDEEGFPYNMDGFFYWKQRVSTESLKLTEKFFTWGDEEKDAVIERFGEFTDKIVTTGNPRIDLWKRFNKIYEEKAAEYKELYGKYILLPSNFGANHINGLEFLIEQAWDYGILENKKDEKVYRDFLEMDKKVLSHYVKLAGKIADAFPGHTVILRPHPVEDHKFWIEKTKNHKNIKVISEGSVTPWILGCEMLIHCSCTTGLEAFLMGKPVISLLPFGKNKIRRHISDEVSYKAASVEDAVEAAKKLLGKKPEDKKEALEGKISYLGKKSSAEKIVEEFDKLHVAMAEFSALKLLILKLKKLLRRKSKLSAYNLQKFKGSSKQEILKISRKFRQVDKKIPIPKIQQLDNNLYILQNG